MTPEQYARALFQLLPPSPIWRRKAAGLLAKIFLASGDELQRVEARGAQLIAESLASTASELLPEYEAELGLDSSGTTAERVARVVARLVARQRYRPVDFQTALASLLGQPAASVVVIENSRAFAISVGDDTEIYKFFIYRDPLAGGTYQLAAAQALVDDIKPSHTKGFVIESINFLCDDPYSLCDRDRLGV